MTELGEPPRGRLMM